ncbi:hypothetical protein COV16_01955 [Candidatus Woesearchaeota archaeon CG10_big_fil_rev_8_21_14_0_10_34_8]|nr:MAG: hypothetical protein COV16_01955 [Candidatus Woesearchaeota archaeon CG10_big_fil_rev_8_21_14_0_10_34_8]
MVLVELLEHDIQGKTFSNGYYCFNGRRAPLKDVRFNLIEVSNLADVFGSEARQDIDKVLENTDITTFYETKYGNSVDEIHKGRKYWLRITLANRVLRYLVDLGYDEPRQWELSMLSHNGSVVPYVKHSVKDDCIIGQGHIEKRLDIEIARSGRVIPVLQEAGFFGYYRRFQRYHLTLHHSDLPVAEEVVKAVMHDINQGRKINDHCNGYVPYFHVNT